ncbi:hypothetical protein BDV3_004888 [Batrachochytrium dendrobatidis]|nr:hypothetical protein QVD99_002713 [Batrachochytrium dendrobatidis]
MLVTAIRRAARSAPIAKDIPIKDIPDAWMRWTDAHSLYYNVSCSPLGATAAKTLASPVLPTELSIDQAKGWLYLKQAAYVERLNAALGQGQWSLQPVGPISFTPSKKIIYRPFALLHDSKFISEAIGESALSSFSSSQDAHIWCEYTALVRTCKDLGIASELWDPEAVKHLRDKTFESSWVKNPTTGRSTRVWKLRSQYNK